MKTGYLPGLLVGLGCGLGIAAQIYKYHPNPETHDLLVVVGFVLMFAGWVVLQRRKGEK